MKKINLKNILKKTFKSKKIKKKSKAKTAKKKISNKKIKIVNKQKKKNLKVKKIVKKIKGIQTSDKPSEKQENIKVSRGPDQKPEIKKIKVQPSEKKIYKVKDYVVYPKHGVGQITEFKKINIGGIDVETYVLKFEKDKANGMVPVNKQSNLRPLATINQLNKCISILKSKPKIKN